MTPDGRQYALPTAFGIPLSGLLRGECMTTKNDKACAPGSTDHCHSAQRRGQGFLHKHNFVPVF